jgi:hypothetical protein
MSGQLALLAPWNEEVPVELSTTLWKKQLLPVGTINYKGRTIQFDKQYLTELAASFRGKAFDQVPFLLAKDDNSHTMDPERFRGEIKGVEVTDKGLDVLVDLTPDAAELVRKNNKLGVSARIIEGLERADGQKFPRAVEHVLGTLSPRVTGMTPWEEVTLSDTVAATLDVSEQEVEVPQPKSPPSVPRSAAKSQAPEAPEPTPTPEELGLSGLDGEVIDMLASRDDENTARIQKLELELAMSRYVNEARELIDAGVPPALVTLAKPVLSLPSAPVIELSNGSTFDVGEVVRNILNEAKGFIELANERGNSFSQGDTEQERATAVLDAWKVG